MIRRIELTERLTAMPYLSKTSYYSPLPILALDRFGKVADFNIALETMLQEDLAGMRTQASTVLLHRIGNRCTQPLVPADLIPPPKKLNGTQALASWTLEMDTSAYGTIDIRGSAIDVLESDSADLLSRVCYLECKMHPPEKYQGFRKAYIGQCRKQLLWDEYALSYDRVVSPMGYYTEVLERHIDALRGPHVRKVVDIGAGTGNLVARLGEGELEVLGIDSSHSMLEQAQRKLEKRGCTNVSLVQQNAESLSQIRDGTVDGVTILLALFDMEHPDRAFAEAIRILRPGGILVITEPKQRFQIEPILTDVKRRWAGDSQREADIARVFRLNTRADFNPEKRQGGPSLRAEDIQRLLVSAGFGNITLRDSHFGNCATVVGRKPEVKG